MKLKVADTLSNDHLASVSAGTPTSNRVTPRMLGFIERMVGTHQRLHCFRIRTSQQGYPDADGDPDRVSVELHGFQRDSQAKAFTQCLGLIKCGVRKEHGELLATRAANDITHSRVPADHPCDVLEDGIACRMAPGVIDMLEIIQV